MPLLFLRKVIRHNIKPPHSLAGCEFFAKFEISLCKTAHSVLNFTEGSDPPKGQTRRGRPYE